MAAWRGRTAAILAAALVGGIAMTMVGRAEDGLEFWRAAEGTRDWREIDRSPGLAAAEAAVTPGQSRDAVRAVLGAPDQDDGDAWVYVVAPDRLVTSEFGYLVVRFDGTGVTAVERVSSEAYTAG